MKTEKQVRTWEIAKLTLEAEHNSVIGPDTAKSFSDETYYTKVIAFDDHLAIVAGLEARIAKLRRLLIFMV